MDETTRQRIEELVKNNAVMLFMKGSPSFPMCGFSGRAVQVLLAAPAPLTRERPPCKNLTT